MASPSLRGFFAIGAEGISKPMNLGNLVRFEQRIDRIDDAGGLVYLNRLVESVPGVSAVSQMSWFGTYYQDPKNFVFSYPVEPLRWRRVGSEYKLPDEQFDAWQRTRTGAVVGAQLARQYGWKLGDRVPLHSVIWTKAGGSSDWDFDIVGIYTAPDTPGRENQFFLRYDYFDEARTFGMANLFKQVGIYSFNGQTYEPEDIGSVLSYREATDGQILEEGISEAGAISSWTAAATSYSVHGQAMLPFYIYYSMFGFQRVGDLIWAAADQRSRGFLLGATAGRTTLGGEGLQHQDGSSLLQASTVPNCRAYDPCFAGEFAVILDHGMRQMLERQEDVFYYVTLMNENYAQPSLPAGVEADVIKGLYRFASQHANDSRGTVRLVGSGTILREVIAAAELLAQDWQVDAEVWSATSFSEVAREAREAERWNRLHPQDAARVSHLQRCLGGQAPVVAASDYVRAWKRLMRSQQQQTWQKLQQSYQQDADHWEAQLAAAERVGVVGRIVGSAWQRERQHAHQRVQRGRAHRGRRSGLGKRLADGRGVGQRHVLHLERRGRLGSVGPDRSRQAARRNGVVVESRHRCRHLYAERTTAATGGTSRNL